MDLGQCAFSGLDDGDAVLGVALGNSEARDLRAQALGDGQAGSVVGSTVDAEAAGELLQGLAQVVLRVGQGAESVVRRGVGIDLHTHDLFLHELLCSVGPILGPYAENNRRLRRRR